MKILFLSGYGIDLSVDSGRLVIKDDRDLQKEPTEIVLKPKGDECDGIVIYGHSGNVSLDAIKWLAKLSIPLTVLNWDGKPLMNVMMPEVKQSRTRIAQYELCKDRDRRLDIGKSIIDGKKASSLQVIDWLTSRYPEIKGARGSCFAEIDEYPSDLSIPSD